MDVASRLRRQITPSIHFGLYIVMHIAQRAEISWGGRLKCTSILISEMKIYIQNLLKMPWYKTLEIKAPLPHFRLRRPCSV